MAGSSQGLGALSTICLISAQPSLSFVGRRYCREPTCPSTNTNAPTASSTSRLLQKISEPPLRKCPSCKKQTMKRLVSAPVFRLKGGGWYETDFKSEQEGKRNLAGGEEAAEAKPDDKSSRQGRQGRQGRRRQDGEAGGVGQRNRQEARGKRRSEQGREEESERPSRAASCEGQQQGEAEIGQARGQASPLKKRGHSSFRGGKWGMSPFPCTGWGASVTSRAPSPSARSSGRSCPCVPTIAVRSTRRTSARKSPSPAGCIGGAITAESSSSTCATAKGCCRSSATRTPRTCSPPPSGCVVNSAYASRGLVRRTAGRHRQRFARFGAGRSVGARARDSEPLPDAAVPP